MERVVYDRMAELDELFALQREALLAEARREKSQLRPTP